jgi:spectinomycin phosphotransferase
VVAPIVTRSGAATQPAGKGYLLAVYPHVDGTAGDFGPHDPDDKTEIYGLLDRLHATKASTAEPLDLELPLRDELHAGKVGDGPYGQRSHDLLRDRRGLIDDLLVEYDRLKGTLPPRDEWVVTHGEPHPGNFMRTREGLRLVDWDTVRLAPRERDLWLVDDRPAYAFFRLRWKLADITVSARDLSLPHSNTEDMSATFGYLREYLAYDST